MLIWLNLVGFVFKIRLQKKSENIYVTNTYKYIYTLLLASITMLVIF